MPNYDAWLEAPYQEHYAMDDLYEQFCEQTDRDPSDDWYEEFDQWLTDQEEEAAERKAEAMMEDARYYDTYSL